jgi:hypothetical protein
MKKWTEENFWEKVIKDPPKSYFVVDHNLGEIIEFFNLFDQKELVINYISKNGHIRSRIPILDLK